MDNTDFKVSVEASGKLNIVFGPNVEFEPNQVVRLTEEQAQKLKYQLTDTLLRVDRFAQK